MLILVTRLISLSLISYLLFFILPMFFSIAYQVFIVFISFKSNVKQGNKDDGNSKSLSIVIPSKNEPKEIVIKNLNNLFKSMCSDEIIVVFDDAIEYVEDIVFSLDQMFYSRGIIVARTNGYGGRNGALSDGARFSFNDLIFLADVDTIPSEELLCKSRKCRDVCVGVWNPYLENYTKVEECMAYITRFGSWIYYQLRSKLNLFIYPLGSGTVIDRKLLESIGFWRYDVIQDDIWLGFELMFRGIKPKLINEYISVGVPKTLNAVRIQQCRWSYGTSNVVSKFMDKIIKAPIDFKRKIEAIVYVFQPIITILGMLAFPIALIGSILEKNMHIHLIYLALLPIFLILQSILFNIFNNKILKIDKWKNLYLSGRVGAIYTLLIPLLGVYALRGLFRIKYRYRITPKFKNISSGFKIDLSEILSLSLSLPIFIISIINTNYITLLVSLPLLISVFYSLIKLEKI